MANASFSSDTLPGGRRIFLGLMLGPILASACYLLLPSTIGGGIDSLSPQARATAAVTVLMGVWWITEAIPLSATALLPVTLFPLLGVTSIAEAAAPYARDLIFLFFGGFMLGLSMEKWELHKRIALIILRLVGGSPSRIIGGFMLVTALLSAWVSNTATAIIMLPIATSVIAILRTNDTKEKGGDASEQFAITLLLAIAYSASIGGIATLIGTPPNLVLASIVEETEHLDISMARWLMVAAPTSAVFLVIVWFVLTRVLFRFSDLSGEAIRGLIRRDLESLGPVSRGERFVFVLFLCTAAAWIARPQLVALGKAYDLTALSTLRDSTIAMVAALLMFVVPVEPRKGVFMLDWQTVTKKTPWSILILFGGGLSLAQSISKTGLAEYIASGMHGLAGMPSVVMVLVIVTAVVFLTEITSNTALTAAMLPVLAAAAPALDLNPIQLLMPATIAASFAFMLPVATPPNAVIFGSGLVPQQAMLRAGFVFNLIGIVIATAAGTLFAGAVVG
jgi:solute carrier family 13 (sodium-dependent dicarboxylate transporter), member 2/3/5